MRAVPLTAEAFAPFGEVLTAPAVPDRVYFERALANRRPAAWPSLSLTLREPAAVPLTVTVVPTALGPVISSSAVVAPSTMTLAPESSSPAVKKRPEDSVRARTLSQSGVVPTTELVQVVEPTVRTWEPVLTGATLPMSGATAGSAKALASAIVRVVAVPRPPRTPLVVELPGETISKLLPRLLIWSSTACCAPGPSPTVRVTDAMPMKMPSTVSNERSRCVRTASSAIRQVSVHLMARPAGAPCRRRPDHPGHGWCGWPWPRPRARG